VQNLHLLEFLAEVFWCYTHHFQCLAVAINQFHQDCQALKMVHITLKASAKTGVSEGFA
jgi:hypothetical protein